jgi:hypothetical protein
MVSKVTPQLLNEITLQVQASPKESPTSAGQTISKELKSSLAASFELMRINYGNQFNAAYPNVESSTAAMRLWLKNLADFPATLIQNAAEQVIQHERYLPNLATFRGYCENAYDIFGLPSADSAYIEACRATQPKKAFKWSHPAVYFAGLATDWFFLSSESKEKVFPVFKRNYEILCARVIKGETLNVPVEKALPAEITTPMTRKENKLHLQQLRDSLKL